MARSEARLILRRTLPVSVKMNLVFKNTIPAVIGLIFVLRMFKVMPSFAQTSLIRSRQCSK